MSLSGPTASAQATSFCGSIGPFQASSSDPDSIYFDRFGNTYLISDLLGNATPASHPFRSGSGGYFNLQIDNVIPMDVETVLCQVFDDVSTLILQRQPTDECGDPVQIQPIIIRVSEEVDEVDSLGNEIEDGILGTASPLYRRLQHRSCPDGSFPVQRSNIMRKLNGEPFNSGFNGVDGLLFIDLTPPNPYYFGNDPANIASNQFDLYSIVLHEIMHLLGFASIINNNGQPDPNILTNYSAWDRILFTTTEYDPNGNNQNVNPLLVSDCEHNCYSLNQNTFSTPQEFENAVDQNCSNNNIDVMVGNPGLAPIEGGNTVSFVNDLSHLNTDCGNPNYVMQAGIDIGEVRRVLVGAEVDILCALGYQTTSCDGCYMAVSENDGTYPINQGNCCNLFYSTCPDQPLLIPFADLLCNDFTNGDSLTITAVSPFHPNSPHTVNIVGDNIEFLSSVQGLHNDINYTVRGCDCELVTGHFSVYVGPCEINCDVSDPCQEILCTNGFEDFERAAVGGISSDYYFGGQFHVGTLGNSPDVEYCPINDNTYIHVGNFGISGPEAIALTLERPIDPNCTLELELDLTQDGANSPGSAMMIKGSDQYPCTAVGSFVDLDCNNSDCNGTTQNYTCIDNIPVTNFSTTCPENWQRYQVSWTNDQSYPITTLIFHPFPRALGGGTSGLLIDNISATLTCTPNISISHTTAPDPICSGQEVNLSYTLCLETGSGPTETNLDYFIQLPTGTTLVNGNLSGTALIQEGACENVMITVAIDTNVPAGTALDFSMDYSATGVCEVITDSYFFEVQVEQSTADAGFTFSVDQCATEVSFTSNSQSGTHSWDFDGDLSTIESNEPNPIFDFQQFGTYTITHTVTDDCGTSTVTQTITLDDCMGETCNCSLQVSGTTLLSDLINSTTFPANELNNQNNCLSIEGTLVIDVNYTIRGGEIEMQPGAKIEVNSGIQLSLIDINENGGIHGCDQLWQHISASAFANLIIQNCIVQDAVHAVRVNEGVNMILADNTFDKNHISVFASGGLNQIFVNAQINNNTFSCTEMLLPDYLSRPQIGPRSRAGINLNSILTMVIGGFWGAPEPNNYTGLEYGILLHNCLGITIQEQQMSGLLRFDHNGFESGYGLQTSASTQIVINDLSVNDARGGIRGDDTQIICNRAAISECTWGIYLQNGRGKDAFIQNAVISTDLNCIWINDYTAGNRIDIQNNALTSLQDGGRGIDLNRLASKVVVKNNPINFASQGIFVFNCIGETTIENHSLNYIGPVWVPGTHTTRGITIQSSQNVQVYNNSITGGIAQREGIVGALSNNILYCCNTVNNATAGVLFLGNNANSRLKSTVFGQHIVGLSMNSAIIGRQEFHGNSWVNAVTNTDAGFYGGVFGINQSRFITNLANIPNGHNKIVVSGNGTPQEWFFFQGGGEPSCSYYCGENPFPPVPPKVSPCDHIKAELTGSDSIIINHSGSLNDIEAGLMWESKLLLYSKLECYPHLMEGHEGATAFYNTASADLVSDYYNFREKLKVFLSLTDEEDYSNLQAQAAGLISDIIILNASIGLPVQEGQTALVAQRDQLIDSLTVIAQQMSLLIQTDQTVRETKASTLLSQVANLGGVDIYHDNEKTVTAIYLETAAIGNYEYSENPIAQLASISQQCPIAGGKTVLLARSLRHHYAYNEDVYDDSCQSSTPRQGQRDDGRDQSVLIYPNPAFDLLQVQMNNKAGYLEIFDLNGVKRQTIVLRDNLNTVNIRNLNAGLYLIRIWTEDMTTPHFQKITILR